MLQTMGFHKMSLYELIQHFKYLQIFLKFSEHLWGIFKTQSNIYGIIHLVRAKNFPKN